MTMVTLLLTTTVLLVNCLTISGNEDHYENIFRNYENFSCAGWLCENEPPPERINGNRYLKQMGCFCDDMCNFFDDCCYDMKNITSKNIDKSLLSYTQCTHQCLVSAATRYYAVVRCPSDYPNNEVAELCSTTNTSDRFLQIPATGKKTGLMYKNIFCAQCHQEEAELWQFYVWCSNIEAFDMETTTSNITDILHRENCIPQILHPPNASDFRPCHRNTIESCLHDADPFIIENCENVGQQLVYADGAVYKNVWCAVCNNKTYPRCFGRGESLQCDNSILQVTGLYSMSLLFDINVGRGRKTVSDMSASEEEEFVTGNSCSSSEIYDPFKDVCRQVSCGDGSVYVNGQCEIREGLIANESRWQNNRTLNNCPRITFSANEFKILDDGRLLETFSRMIHDPEDFIIEGASATVCALDHTNTSDTFRRFVVVSLTKFSSLQGIISGTGMIISLVALLVTIIVYITFKSLRNIPGCNILCLSVALFVAELLMLTAPMTENNPTICKIFGIGMHYFFLVAFMWMNVIAVDAWSTFSRGIKSVRNTQSLKLRFTIYSLHAWLVPCAPVVTAIIMDLILPLSIYAPNYGQSVCWINNRLAVLVFFAAPLGFVVFVNTVLFVITSVTICSVKRSSARQLGRNVKSEFLIYIKLFLVMGLTWILGFLSAFVPHPATTYLYIIVNSLQGLFIGISFVCTRKVFGLFREKLRGPQSESTVTSDRHVSSFTSHM